MGKRLRGKQAPSRTLRGICRTQQGSRFAGQLEPGLGGRERRRQLSQIYEKRRGCRSRQKHKVSGRSIALAERVEVHGSVWAEQVAVLGGMPEEQLAEVLSDVPYEEEQADQPTNQSDDGMAQARLEEEQADQPTDQSDDGSALEEAEQDSGSMFEQAYAFEEAQQGRQAAEEHLLAMRRAAMRFILGFDLHFGHLVQSQQI